MKIHNCERCEYIRMYDYGKRIYYCDHEDRINDIGKIGVSDIPEASPEWCPMRYGNGKNVESDLIKIKSDIQLTDKWGQPVPMEHDLSVEEMLDMPGMGEVQMGLP